MITGPYRESWRAIGRMVARSGHEHVTGHMLDLSALYHARLHEMSGPDSKFTDMVFDADGIHFNISHPDPKPRAPEPERGIPASGDFGSCEACQTPLLRPNAMWLCPNCRRVEYGT